MDYRCVTAQLPTKMFDALEKLNDEEYPGVARQTLIRAAIAMLLEADEKSFAKHLGRY